MAIRHAQLPSRREVLFQALAGSEPRSAARFLGCSESIRHKGLKKFFNSGGKDVRGIDSDHEDKLRDQLAALDSATDIADMDLPGWRLHPLKGKDKGRHAIWVSGNWRMSFEFENGDAYVVDYEDYH